MMVGRERVNTGRVENLRSMGAELMRPSSQDGTNNGGIGAGLEAAKMRNSGSGFYQPSTKYAADFRRTTEEAEMSSKTYDGRTTPVDNQGSMPDASEIQNRLKKATNY